MRYCVSNMKQKIVLDPFALMILITIFVSGWIVFDVYFNQNYVTFITEEEITDSKNSEFGFLSSFI